MNQFLRKKRFIDVLKESGIVDILNQLYQDILSKVSD